MKLSDKSYLYKERWERKNKERWERKNIKNAGKERILAKWNKSCYNYVAYYKKIRMEAYD